MFEVIVQYGNGRQETFDDFDHAPSLGTVVHVGNGRYAKVLAIRKKQKNTIWDVPGVERQNRYNR